MDFPPLEVVIGLQLLREPRETHYTTLQHGTQHTTMGMEKHCVVVIEEVFHARRIQLCTTLLPNSIGRVKNRCAVLKSDPQCLGVSQMMMHGIYLYIHICLSLCLPTYLSVYPSVCLCLSLSVGLSVYSDGD